MKRGLFLILCLSFSLLLFPSVSAFTVTVFDDYFVEEEPLEVEGINYTAYGHHEYEELRLHSNEYGDIIIAEDGTETAGPYKYIFDRVTDTSGEIRFYVTITKEQPEVNMHRTISEYNPFLGEVVEVTVTIENEGDDTVTVTYMEDLPSETYQIGLAEITVGSSTRAQKEPFADVYWKGALYVGETATIVYGLQPEAYPDEGNVIRFEDVTFTIDDDSGTYDGIVDPLSITLAEPVSLDFVQESETIEINQAAHYTMYLFNALPREVTVENILLRLPDTVELIEIDDAFVLDEEGYSWSGILALGEEIPFSLIVRPLTSGNNRIIADVTYLDEGIPVTFESSVTLTTDVEELIPIIKLSSATFDAGETIGITYSLNNTDATASYDSLEVKLESELFGIENYLVGVGANTTRLVKTHEFTAPYTDAVKEYKVTMSGTYADNSFKKTETITINEAIFTSPYGLEYEIEDVSEGETTVGLTLTILASQTEIPSRLAVVHTAKDFKKTVSLTTAEIATFLSSREYTTSFTVPTLIYTDDVNLDIQLEYDVLSGTYYKSYSEIIPVFVAEVEDIEEVAENVIEPEAEPEVEEEVVEEIAEPTVVITNEDDVHSQRWLFLIGVVIVVALIAAGVHYFIAKKKKANDLKKSIAQMHSSKDQMFSTDQKEIVIHEAPTPEDGYVRLDSYIEHSLGQGKSIDSIRQVLLDKGWMEEVINAYLQRFKDK